MGNSKQSQHDAPSNQYKCERCWSSEGINLYPRSQFLEGEDEGFVILCNDCKGAAPKGTSGAIFEELFLKYASPKELMIHYNVQNEEEAKRLWCEEHNLESADYDIMDGEESLDIQVVEDDDEYEDDDSQDPETPFGYIMDNTKMTVNETEAGIVRFIYERYLDGYTMEKIARNLDCNPPLGTLKVRDILKDPIYAGYTYRGQDLIKGSQEAIIPVETFNSVQQKIVRNIRNPKYLYKPLQLTA